MQLIGTFVDYDDVESGCSSYMSSTLSHVDESYNHIEIRFNLTQAIAEQEQQAYADPYATLNK